MPGIDAQTVLMLHCDGANASTSFPDDSGKGHTVTAQGAAQVLTNFSKFGGASYGGITTGCSLALDGSADFAFGSGDYTLDFWLKVFSLANPAHLYDARPAATLGAYLVVYVNQADGKLHCTNGTTDIAGTTNLNTNTWRHIAVSREGTTRRLFVDGTQEASDVSDSVSLLNPAGRPWFAGKSYGGDGGAQGLIGWMDEIRVSKGIARYTGNFTPPTEAYALDPVAQGRAILELPRLGLAPLS